jgi:hypothetical protein
MELRTAAGQEEEKKNGENLAGGEPIEKFQNHHVPPFVGQRFSTFNDLWTGIR